MSVVYCAASQPALCHRHSALMGLGIVDSPSRSFFIWQLAHGDVLLCAQLSSPGTWHTGLGFSLWAAPSSRHSSAGNTPCFDFAPSTVFLPFAECSVCYLSPPVLCSRDSPGAVRRQPQAFCICFSCLRNLKHPSLPNDPGSCWFRWKNKLVPVFFFSS